MVVLVMVVLLMVLERLKPAYMPGKQPKPQHGCSQSLIGMRDANNQLTAGSGIGKALMVVHVETMAATIMVMAVNFMLMAWELLVAE